MYKMLMFPKKSDDPNVKLHFKEHTLNILSEIAGKKIKPAEVESSLLLEKKYTLFCEISVDSKEKWDKMMTSGEGKKLNKDLMDFHPFIDLIFVNFEEEL
jgi:hypothetical protein